MMEKKLMSTVFVYKGYVWINIPKCASSFFREEFIKKINTGSDEYFWFRWKERITHNHFREEFQKFIKNGSKLKLLLHVRDPWDRFKASVREDFKIKYQNIDMNNISKELIYKFCKNVELRYSDFNFESPKISLSSGLYEGWNLLFLKMADRVFSALDLFKDYIESVELWRYENIEQSIKERFSFDCVATKRNAHPDLFKDIVDNFFNDKHNFIKDWKKIHSNDIKLFDIIGDNKSISLDIRTFTKLFFKKIDVS